MVNPPIYIEKLELIRPNESFQAGLCLCWLTKFNQYEEIVANLDPKEQQYYETLKFEKRIKSYLTGRLAAKKAIAALTGNNNLAKIAIQRGIFTQPIATCEGQPNIQVSISHCEDFGAAIAFPEAHPMGIDLEKIAIKQNQVIEREVTEAEINLIKTFPVPYEKMLTLLWTAKEALSKVLKTGLMTPFQIYEIAKIDLHPNYLLCTYKNFAQYKAMSFFLGKYSCSLTYPMKTELRVDLYSLRKALEICNE
ncbi:MAG TPA: 4'-phosphopantetheinyl transferase superfamily protein [Bacillota bacterium]